MQYDDFKYFASLGCHEAVILNIIIVVYMIQRLWHRIYNSYDIHSTQFNFFHMNYRNKPIICLLRRSERLENYCQEKKHTTMYFMAA